MERVHLDLAGVGHGGFVTVACVNPVSCGAASDSSCESADRLRDLGFREGIRVRVISRSDPMICQVGNCRVGLCRTLAKCVMVCD